MIGARVYDSSSTSSLLVVASSLQEYPNHHKEGRVELMSSLSLFSRTRDIPDLGGTGLWNFSISQSIPSVVRETPGNLKTGKAAGSICVGAGESGESRRERGGLFQKTATDNKKATTTTGKGWGEASS